MKKLKVTLWAALLLTASVAKSQITVTNTQTPTELVNDVLVGAGVTISNVEFNHSIPLAEAIQVQAGYFNAEGTTFPMEEGIILATGNVAVAVGPNDSGGASDNVGVAPDPGDEDLIEIGTAPIFNAAILEFDFVPDGDSVVFNYIFASEEYLEYVDAGVNDVFGFFISGPGFAGPFEFGGENIATIPGTEIPVAIDNLNDEDFPEYYIHNDGGLDVQYDGHTTILTAAASVECGETYHIKMAIGDSGDPVWDSGVFIEASSFSSNGINVEIASVLGADALIEDCDSATVTFIRPEEADTVDLEVEFSIGGTAENGVDYEAIDETVFFPVGEDSVVIYIKPIDDGLDEGPESITITVEIINECGDTIFSEAVIEIVDVLEYDVLTEDITFDCYQDSVLLSYTTDGGIPEFDIDWSSGGDEEEEWVIIDGPGTTTYTVTLTDHCGMVAEGEIDVTYDPADSPTITFDPDDIFICPGTEITIDATITDPYHPDSVITYEWFPGGETTEDITSTPEEEGWYVLTIFDGCNFSADSVEIEFGDVNITNIDVIDAIDCPGVPDAVLGSISVEPDDPTWTYEIVGYVPPQDNGNFTDLSGGIDYIVVVTDENGCTKDTIVSVGTGDNEVIATWDLDSLRNISCFGEDDGGAYVYDIGGGITPPFTATWTNIAGVFDTDTGIPVGGDSEQDNLPPGDWVVTVTDEEGCAWSQTFEILEPELLELDIISNDPTCHQFSDGSVTALTAGGNGGNIYEIRDGDGNLLNIENSNTANNLPQGTYFVTVTDANGCTVSGDVTITHPDQIDVELEITQPQCYGIPTGYVEVINVINATGDPDQIGYYWAPNPSGVDGIGANIQKGLEAGSYTLTINDENGCSNVFDFTIEYPDELVFTDGGLGFEHAYCRVFSYQNGNGVVFASATGGTGSPEYEWVELATGATSTNTTWGGRNPGLYEITVTDDNGCTLIDTIRVDSLNPIAEFDVISEQLNTDLQGTAPVEVTFVNQSLYYANPNNPLADPRFHWNLAHGEVAWQITDDFFKQYDTTYYEKNDSSYQVEVCLVAQNKNGCKDTACKTITVYEEFAFENVNVFSPNGDGDNDIFTFKNYSKSVTTFNCVIVNRWGVKVGEITDVNAGWDGTDLNGTPCTDGVYYYTYTGVSDDGNKFEGQGNVTIVGSTSN